MCVCLLVCLLLDFPEKNSNKREREIRFRIFRRSSRKRERGGREPFKEKMTVEMNRERLLRIFFFKKNDDLFEFQISMIINQVMDLYHLRSLVHKSTNRRETCHHM